MYSVQTFKKRAKRVLETVEKAEKMGEGIERKLLVAQAKLWASELILAYNRPRYKRVRVDNKKEGGSAKEKALICDDSCINLLSLVVNKLQAFRY